MNLMHHFAGKPLACSAVMLRDGKPVTRADAEQGPEGIGPIAGNEVHARFEMERGMPACFDSIARAGDKAAALGGAIIGTSGIINIRCDTPPTAPLTPGTPLKPAKEP